jgi:hypothetical protein
MVFDLIHLSMAFTFFALWGVSCHIAVVSRRAREDGRGADFPVSGNVGQR